jgi:hypothetical protein
MDVEYRGTRGLRGRTLSMQVDTTMMHTKTYGSGRVCRVEGCGTLLSAYNPSSICALHSGGWKDELKRTTRRQRPREEMTRYCSFEPCGREFVTSNPAKKYCSDACRMRAFQARVVASRHGHGHGRDLDERTVAEARRGPELASARRAS